MVGLLLLAQCSGAVTTPGSLAKCLEVAAVFQNTCTEAPNGPAASVSGMTGEQYSCSNVGMCAGTASGTTCTWTRRLCVSCVESGGVVRIRLQTNGLPGHCYSSPVITPAELDVDFSAIFSPALDPSDPKEAPDSQVAVDSLLCDIQRHVTVPSSSGFQSHGTQRLNTVSGVATTGTVILNQNSVEDVDPFYPSTWSEVPSYNDAPEKIDKCLGHPQAEGMYHYHMISPCMLDLTARTGGNLPCNSQQGCADIKAHAMAGFTASDGRVVVGVAKDGNIIYGPYDDDGGPISGLDVCNGREIDGTYSYVGSETFPYYSGCFGPGNYPAFQPACTTNGLAAYIASPAGATTAATTASAASGDASNTTTTASEATFTSSAGGVSAIVPMLVLYQIAMTSGTGSKC
mmetsp:Transcript_107713/g.246699  ORF Transcript_107713/g.246699 Transcript_107713/m.246699 type:complete len:402 (+) Transcript_107713:502-1707(+)